MQVDSPIESQAELQAPSKLRLQRTSQHQPMRTKPATPSLLFDVGDSNAFERLSELRGSTQLLINEYMKPTQRGSDLLLRQILLAFELTWKLEELVLMPALQDPQSAMVVGSSDAQRELAALRDLVAVVREDGLPLGQERMLLGAIQSLAALRTQRFSSALARRSLSVARRARVRHRVVALDLALA